MFNLNSRMKYSGYFSSFELRFCLWSYLRSEILSLQLNCGGQEDREKGLYNISLLRLLKGLIMKGFFDESNQFIIALRVEEEEEEDENDDDNSSDNNDKNGCFNWMMKDRTSTVGKYSRCSIKYICTHLLKIFLQVILRISEHLSTSTSTHLSTEESMFCLFLDIKTNLLPFFLFCKTCIQV